MLHYSLFFAVASSIEPRTSDINECQQKNTCHEKAVCTNTPGRYFCQCMEGFSGDGVTECVASFLYPTAGTALQRSRNSRSVWELKYPLRIFGEGRDKLIVSSSGLITVKEMSAVSHDAHLDDMDVLGIAPFFAPIDITQRGEVTISESTDSDVLTRATQLVNENLAVERFTATSVVTVSWMNVTAAGTQSTPNTFQTLLIGGTNKRNEPMTFVQFLYKDIG